MKRFWKALAAAAVLLILIYRLGTLNFYLGSNSAFFSSAFDDENSSWYCKDLGLTATDCSARKQTQPEPRRLPFLCGYQRILNDCKKRMCIHAHLFFYAVVSVRLLYSFA